MTLTLVDSPLTPYSSLEEIRAWVRECDMMVENKPDDVGWLDARDEAKELEMISEAKA